MNKAVYNLINQLSIDKRFYRYFTDKTATVMQLNEKIRFIRHIKKWSQEEVAHRLGISTSAYGSIERGETTRLSLPQLEEMAKVFEIGLAELIDSDEKNVFNISGGEHKNHFHYWYSHSSSEQLPELKQELDKARLEIEYLKQQNNDLREMVNLLKHEGKGR